MPLQCSLLSSPDVHRLKATDLGVVICKFWLSPLSSFLQRDMAREVARKSSVILKNGKTPSDAPLQQLPKTLSDAQLLPLPKKMTNTNDGLICVQLHCLFLNQWRSFLLIILT
ncbi:hypothetical protein ACQJBY_060383 [Aegilops geniculata]